MIQLSTIAPDFASLVAQIQAAAQSFPNTWKDRITSSTGQTLTEALAAIGAYSQYSIESSYQEVWPDSAKNAEAVYAAVNFAGVRIKRRGPAALSMNMAAGSSRTIPPMSQFLGAGTYWFNRDALILTTTPSTVVLYQGQIVKTTTSGDGSAFQAFVSAERDFHVSDTDVLLKINGNNIPVIQEGLWTKPGVPGVQQFTLPGGEMIILFGNSVYGTVPKTNDVCEITYVDTLGADGNNIVVATKVINLDGDITVSGIPTVPPSGGGNENDFIVYKNIAPALFGEFDSAVTAPQYKKRPLKYPGVIDARVIAQKDINPKAVTWMNSMKMTLLTSSPWNGAAFLAFSDWYNAGTMASTRIHREDPLPVDVVVTGKISCKNYSNLSAIQVKVKDALASLFELRQGSIGLDIYRSDVIKAIVEADANIEFCQLTSPPADVILSSLGVNFPILTEYPGMGTLPAGTYDYAVSNTSTLGGDSAPTKWQSIKTVSPFSAVQVQWFTAPNTQNYHVWGRITGGALGKIADVSGSTLLYLDTGSVTPTLPLQSQSTIASYYPRLQATNLVMAYTTRNLR